MAKLTKKIVLRGLRASYPHLFSPDQMSGKYTCDFILPKDSPQLPALKEAVKAVYADAVKSNPGKTVECKVLKDGDLEKAADAAFANCFFIKTKTSSPAIKQNVFKRISASTVEKIEDESEFYGGCNCSASLAISWYEFSGKYGVHVLLNGVCREEGGEPFGNNGNVSGDFTEGAQEAIEDMSEDIF